MARNGNGTRCERPREHSFCCPVWDQVVLQAAPPGRAWFSGLALTRFDQGSCRIHRRSPGYPHTRPSPATHLLGDLVLAALFLFASVPNFASVIEDNSPYLVHTFAVWSGEGTVCRPIVRGAEML